MGESKNWPLRVRFDRPLRLEFHTELSTRDPSRRNVQYTQQMIFELAEVAVSRDLFAINLEQISRLRPVPA
ncbi:MAG: hypothetical protein ACE5JS_20550 [Nitrospinota bacterium]